MELKEYHTRSSPPSSFVLTNDILHVWTRHRCTRSCKDTEANTVVDRRKLGEHGTGQPPPAASAVNGQRSTHLGRHLTAVFTLGIPTRALQVGGSIVTVSYVYTPLNPGEARLLIPKTPGDDPVRAIAKQRGQST